MFRPNTNAHQCGNAADAANRRRTNFPYLSAIVMELVKTKQLGISNLVLGNVQYSLFKNEENSFSVSIFSGWILVLGT